MAVLVLSACVSRVQAQTAPSPAGSAIPPSVTFPPSAPPGGVPPASSAAPPAPAATAPPRPLPPPLKVPNPAEVPTAEAPRPPDREPAAYAQPASPSRAAAPGPAEDDIERRVVVFTDGSSPQLVSSGQRNVHGPLELEIRFHNANPLCYEYSTNVAASRVAASDLPLPDRVPGIGSLGAVSTASFTNLDDAFSAVNSAQTDLDEVLNAARIEVSLEDVWAACDGRSDSSWQRSRVEAAAQTLTMRVGPMGSWRQILERAEATALGAKRFSRDLEIGEQEAVQEVEAKKSALSEVEQKEQALRDQSARTGPTHKLKAELDDAARDIASAQRHVREAELKLAKHRRAGDLGRSAERLADRVAHVLETLSANVAEINRARSLLARSPTAIRRRFGAGRWVAVIVERARLERGERVEGRRPQLFEVPAYHTLRPVILDLGIGPGLGIGRSTAHYESEIASINPSTNTYEYRVVRTEQGIPLDVLASLSVYIWQSRYFDYKVFDPIQLIPRPMIGISLAHPLSTFYAGFSIDPIQYLDISGGVRWANEEVVDSEATAANGNVTPPVIRSEARTMGFVAISISTNLLYSWMTTKM